MDITYPVFLAQMVKDCWYSWSYLLCVRTGQLFAQTCCRNLASHTISFITTNSLQLNLAAASAAHPSLSVPPHTPCCPPGRQLLHQLPGAATRTLEWAMAKICLKNSLFFSVRVCGGLVVFLSLIPKKVPCSTFRPMQLFPVPSYLRAQYMQGKYSKFQTISRNKCTEKEVLQNIYSTIKIIQMYVHSYVTI